MGSKYTPGQAKAIQNYRKDKHQIALTLTQEEKSLIQSGADRRGLSVKKYIMELAGGKDMIKALNILYNELGFEEANIFNDIQNDYLTENETRSGRKVLWYTDENNNVAVYIDTLQLLSEDEIENELM